MKTLSEKNREKWGPTPHFHVSSSVATNSRGYTFNQKIYKACGLPLLKEEKKLTCVAAKEESTIEGIRRFCISYKNISLTSRKENVFLFTDLEVNMVKEHMKEIEAAVEKIKLFAFSGEDTLEDRLMGWDIYQRNELRVFARIKIQFFRGNPLKMFQALSRILEDEKAFIKAYEETVTV